MKTQEEIKTKLFTMSATPLAGKSSYELDCIVRDIEEALGWGCTRDEACVHAGIRPKWFSYLAGWDPELSTRVDEYGLHLSIDAQRTLAASLKSNIVDAKWYLERVKKDKYTARQEHTGADGKDLNGPVIYLPQRVEVAKGPEVPTPPEPTPVEQTPINPS